MRECLYIPTKRASRYLSRMYIKLAKYRMWIRTPSQKKNLRGPWTIHRRSTYLKGLNDRLRPTRSRAWVWVDVFLGSWGGVLGGDSWAKHRGPRREIKIILRWMAWVVLDINITLLWVPFRVFWTFEFPGSEFDLGRAWMVGLDWIELD